MHHAKFQEEDASEDAFLDVVANVVGVLIILIMLVGAQASRSVLVAQSPQLVAQSPQKTPAPEIVVQPTSLINLQTLRTELEQATETARTSELAVSNQILQVAKITHEANTYDNQRVELAMHRSLMEEDLERRKEQLGEQQQREFDTQRQLLESKLDLDDLTKEQLSLSSASETVTEVECVPTPLARLVEGDSIHLRLSKGLVSIVPFEALMEEMQYNIEGTKRRLQNRNQTIETFGPLDGYRLKFTMVRHRPQNSVGGPLVGQTQRAKISWEIEILPMSTEIGQNVEQSLLPGGALHKHLLAHQRQRPAVVVWLCTDSFDEFRPLKRALWEMGFSMATRPLRPGKNIKASPDGTRAAAQ